MTEHGWVAIWRKILEWPVWQAMTSDQKVVTVTMILMANWKDGVWFCKKTMKNIKIPRGSFVATQARIAERSNVGRQVVRTTLKILQTKDDVDPEPFLTINLTKHYAVYTIRKYSEYQNVTEEANQASNHAPTTPQPRPNHAPTTIEQGKQGKQGITKKTGPPKEPAPLPTSQGGKLTHFLQRYHDAWLAKYGSKPVITWNGANRVTAKSLMASFDWNLSKAKAAVDAYLESDGWSAGKGHQLNHMASWLNEHRAKSKSGGRGVPYSRMADQGLDRMEFDVEHIGGGDEQPHTDEGRPGGAEGPR